VIVLKGIKCFIIFLIVLISTVGCKMDKKEESKIEKIEKAPDSLSEVSEGIQEILKDIEIIEKVIDGTDTEDAKAKVQKEKEVEKEEEETQDKDKQETQDKGKNESENKTESQNKEKPIEKDEKLLEQWEKVDKKIKEVHEKWNTYQPESVKKGATTDKTDKFGESVNSLTKSIERRDIKDIYNFASESMLNLKPIFDLYRDEIKGDINKLKYITYQSYLKFMDDKVTQSVSLLNEAQEDIEKIKLKVEKKDSKIDVLGKLELSIRDMSKSLRLKSINLIRIKKDIIIKNLEELDK
jgi:hypothetical protein